MSPTEELSIRQVRELEDAWRVLIRSGKWDEVAKLLEDDYTNTDADGNVWTKKMDIQNCESGSYEVEDLSDAAELKPRPYGDNCVVVTGRDTIKATFNNKDVSGTYRWTDTWIKKSDGWLCVASHSSRVPG